MNTLAVVGAAYAYANWGRWVADCPHPHCRSALQLNPTEPVFQCWECGTVADLVWPPNVEDIERLLLMRPDSTTRNWVPGETLHDLMLENLAHGILPLSPAELETHPGGRLLQIAGDRIAMDALTAPTRRMLERQ